MRLKFVRERIPTCAEDLTPLEREQLEFAGVLYHGGSLSAAQLLSDDPKDEEQSFLGYLYIWDIIDEDQDDAHVYTYFAYCVDSGVFFRAGSTEYDADVIQFYLHNPVSEELAQALGDAVERQREALGHARFRV